MKIAGIVTLQRLSLEDYFYMMATLALNELNTYKKNPCT